MSKILQLVGFKVEREFFGVQIAAVKEIVRVPQITPVPDTPIFVEGVINLRGMVVPVIDMRKRIGAPPVERQKENRVLILELDGKIVGITVDSASEIIKLPEDAIEPPPEIVSYLGGEYVTGVGKLKERLIVLLDLARLLRPEEMKRMETIGKQITPGVEREILQEGKTREALEQGGESASIKTGKQWI